MDRENEKKIWEKRILDFEASNTTIVEFSKAHGFSVHQYYYWKNKIIKTKIPATRLVTTPAPQSQLIKVIPQPLPISSLPDPIWLANLIKALHEVP